MRKTLFTLLALLLVGLFSATLVEAAAPTVTVGVSAQVPNNSPQLEIIIKELTTPGQNPWTGTTVATMNFGQLTHTLTGGGEAGVWYSQKYYCVFVYPSSFGHQYEIKSTCAGLVSGGNFLPTGSFGLTPQYIAQEEWSPGNPQGAQPAGSQLGSAASAITSNKLIYRSEPAASNRIIRAFYSLPAYLAGGGDPHTGYQPIPLSQAPGTYTGTVTITVAAY